MVIPSKAIKYKNIQFQFFLRHLFMFRFGGAARAKLQTLDGCRLHLVGASSTRLIHALYPLLSLSRFPAYKFPHFFSQPIFLLPRTHLPPLFILFFFSSPAPLSPIPLNEHHPTHHMSHILSIAVNMI